MDMHLLLHHLLTLLFFLVLPRLPATPASESDNMEVLVLERVGYIPTKGLYACFTRMGGAAPDLTLQYSATYTHGPSNTLATCNADVSQHISLLDGSVAYCLSPCPGMEVIYPDPMSVVVTGHDRITREIHASLMESFTLSSVTPTVIQPGGGVVEVQWDAWPGRTYRVQLWHHPEIQGETARAAVEVEGNIGVTKTETGEMERGGVGETECNDEVVQGAGGSLTESYKEVEECERAAAEGLMEEEEIRHCGVMREKDTSVTGNEEMDEVATNGKLLNENNMLEGKEVLSEESVSGIMEEGGSEMKTDPSGSMDNETLIKIRLCYQSYDNDNDTEDDDDDYDIDDEDDHEEDNDDFIKFMRWRKCVALYSPWTAIASASTPTVLHTSRPLNCTAGPCLYYFTDAPSSGSLSVEIMDITNAFVLSSHIPPTPVQAWGSLAIDTVMVTSEGVGADPRTKTLRITLPGTSKGSEDGSTETGEVEGEGEMEVEAESAKGDLQAVVINGHSHSEALKNLPGECDPLGDVCLVRDLQTLVDPEERGPVSSMFLLLSDHHAGTSSLVSITDVHVRVHKVAPGTAAVLWDREPSVQEFIVRVISDSGVSSDTVAVACSKRGTDCLATFSSLASGQYQAEVSYTKKTKVVLSSQFFMEDGIVSEQVPANEQV